MPANEDRLLYRLEAQDRQFQQVMRRVNQTLDRTTAQNRRMLARMEADTRAASARIWAPLGDGLRNQLAGLSGVLAAAFSADQILRMADGFTALENRLKVAGLEGEALAGVMDHLFEAASRNGVEVGALGELYGRLALSTGDLGISQEQLLGLMDGVTAALRVQGVSSQAASGALIQLSQALGSGTVRAEELNSLLEQTPVILQAAASGMGISVAALSAQIREGEVSSREFFDALMTGFPAIQEQAQNATLTIGQAMTSLSNELLRYIGMSDDSLGASERLAGAIQALAENLDVVVTTAGIAIGIVGTRMVVSFTLATASAINYQAALLTMAAAQTGVSRTALLASTAVAGLRTAMMFLLTNPFGIAITAIATALALLALRGDDASDSQRELENSVNRTEDALNKYRDAAEAARQASDENAAAARRNADAMRAEAVEAIRSAIALRQRTAALRDEAVADAESAAQRVRTAVGQAQVPLAQGEYARLNQIADAARRAAREADDALGDALKGLYNIDNPINVGGADAASADTGGAVSGGGRSGPSAADLARQAEELANRRSLFELEQELEIARAGGDERRIAALEDEIALRRLIEQMQELGIENAEAAAGNHIDALRQMATEEERLALLSAERAKRDEEAADQRERELEAQRQIADAEARRQGEIEDRANSAAQTIVSVLRADNIWEEAGRRIQDAMWNGVEQILSQLLQQAIGGIGSQQGGGGGFGSILSSVFSAFTGQAIGAPGAGSSGLTPGIGGTFGKTVGAPMGAMIEALPGKALAGGPQTIVVQVDKSEYFDVAVSRKSAETVARSAPLIVQAAQARTTRGLMRSQQSALGRT